MTSLCCLKEATLFTIYYILLYISLILYMDLSIEALRAGYFMLLKWETFCILKETYTSPLVQSW